MQADHRKALSSRLNYLWQKIKQFGSHRRQAGGVTAVEVALWDIIGKAYGVPIYQMLGGKFRDKIRIYADTTESKDPAIYAKREKERKEVMGLTWLKMDLGIEMVSDIRPYAGNYEAEPMPTSALPLPSF